MVDRMSLPIIDEALTAYTKGELPPEARLRIEQVLGHDPEAAARVGMLRRQRQAGRASHGRRSRGASKTDHISFDPTMV
jgi:anti-sigma factor RsiW